MDLDNILRLECHPESPAKTIESIEVSIQLSSDGRLWLRYHVECELENLETGFPKENVRTDGLWYTTCFELFVNSSDGYGYIELNFAPSSQWAAYQFTNYREDIQNLELQSAPVIVLDASDGHFALEAEISLPEIWRNMVLNTGISAVIEESNGTKSYWALVHKEAHPDFHDRACFTYELKAAEQS